jgi:hypothetical protein
MSHFCLLKGSMHINAMASVCLSQLVVAVLMLSNTFLHYLAFSESDFAITRTIVQHWKMKEGADLVDLFFPDTTNEEHTASADAVAAQSHWSQAKDFQAALDGQRDILRVFVVAAADGVERMVAAWPWESSHRQVPFNGVAMTANLLPGTLSSLMLRRRCSVC